MSKTLKILLLIGAGAIVGFLVTFSTRGVSSGHDVLRQVRQTLTLGDVMNTNAKVESKSANLGVRIDKKIQSCHSSDIKRTFPDIDYSFYGYNILKGYPLANGRDPGFTRPVFASDFSTERFTSDCRYWIPKGLTVAPDVSCVTSFTSEVLESSHQLAKSLSASAHVSGGGWGAKFSASAGYQKTSSKFSASNQKVVLSTAHCNYYFSKFNRMEPPPFSDEIKEWLRILIAEYKDTGKFNTTMVYEFYQYFGTHFSIDTVYGARFTYEHTLDAQKAAQAESSKISVEMQASYSGLFSLSGGFSLSKEQQQAASSFSEKAETKTISVGAPPPYNGDAMTWASKVKDAPVPVKVFLEPIYKLFDKKYMKQSQIDEETADKLLDKMIEVSRSYCLRAAMQGLQVECYERSTLKIPGICTSYVSINKNSKDRNNPITQEGKVAKNENDCIEECLRRQSCIFAAFEKHNYKALNPSTVNPMFPSCVITMLKPGYKTAAAIPYIHHEKCSEISTTYDKRHGNLFMLWTDAHPINIIRIPEVTIKTGFRHMALITGSSTISDDQKYDMVSDFCSYMCSIDSQCVGFVVATYAGDTNFNCGTVTEGQMPISQPIPTHDNSRKDFTLQAMFEKTKTAMTKALVAKSSFHVPCTMITKSVTTLHGVSKNSCYEKCIESDSCIAAYDPATTCTLQKRSDKAYECIGAPPANWQATKVYPNRQEEEWVNITGIVVSSGCSSHEHSVASADECAQLCIKDLYCQVASFENGKCNVARLYKPTDTLPVNCMVRKAGNVKVFAPSFKIKMAYYMSLIPQ